MKAFVFRPSNHLITKLDVSGLDDVPSRLKEFIRIAPSGSVPPYSYVEASGKTWTIINVDPFQVTVGRSMAPPSESKEEVLEPQSPFVARTPVVGVLRFFAWANLICSVVVAGWLLAGSSDLREPLSIAIGVAFLVEGIFGCALLLVVAEIAEDVRRLRLQFAPSSSTTGA
jgi:hypothetical protein